jgi:hypothetical protein
LVWLSDFSAAATLTGVLLPAGELSVQAFARDSLGAVTAAPAVARVSVAITPLDALNLTALFPADLPPIAAAARIFAVTSLLDDATSGGSAPSDDAELAGTRAELLAVLAAIVTSPTAPLASQTPAAAENMAVATAALVSTPAQANTACVEAALSVLNALSAASGASTSPATVAAIANGLSSLVDIATLALGGGGQLLSGGGNSTGAAAVLVLLQAAVDVVDVLSDSLLRTFTTPGEAPVLITTPAIQMYLALDQAGAGSGSRLFSQGISAPGALSAFQPLPAGIFDGLDVSGGVRTQFASFSFDMHQLQAVNSSTGVTRLVFTSSADGTELPVANLSAPVLFSLPPLAAADGLKAQCQFWEVAAGTYSTAGCAWLPNPTPRNHTVRLKAKFTAANDADIVRTWDIDGALTAGCRERLLDCAAPGQPAMFADPSRPFSSRALRCDAAVGTAPVRIFMGAACALIQPDNAYGCFWNNTGQTFQGAGCVASGGPVSCACRHLTDFSSASEPSAPMVSVEDLVLLRPADIVKQLRWLLIVVASLFGAMHVGAGAGFVLDARERRAFVTALQRHEVGFCPTLDGAWLWRFSMQPSPHKLGAPSGAAVELCALLGVPMVRIRAALPDDLLTWGLSAALGRRAAMSRAGMEEARTLQKQLLPSFFGSLRRNKRRDLVEELGVFEAEAATEKSMAAAAAAPHDARAEMLEQLVGTAIVLAFLQVAQLASMAELARHRSVAKAHFAGVTTPAGWDFDKTRTAFVTMLRCAHAPESG